MLCLNWGGRLANPLVK